MISDPIKLAVIGLGRGFALSARGLNAHPGINLVAGAARSEGPRTAFEKTFGAHTYADYADMLADPEIEMVYVATPHQLHKNHVTDCLNAGKHVVVEKPIAISLEDAASMVRLADANGLKLLVGPSHSYDAAVQCAADEVASGRHGAPRLLTMLTATDFLYRPRRPEELDTAQGGGVVFSQAVHQFDVAMRLLGSKPVSVFAKTGKWDPDRPTEGAFTAIVSFENGSQATLTYSGYGRFDSDALMGSISELGVTKSPKGGGFSKSDAVSSEDELKRKKSRAFSGLDGLPEPQHHEHFGQTVLFCERGDISLTPDAIRIHAAGDVTQKDCEFHYSRQTFAQAIYDALRGRSPKQTGAWGFAALATCHALLKSAATGQPEPVISIEEVPHA